MYNGTHDRKSIFTDYFLCKYDVTNKILCGKGNLFNVVKLFKRVPHSAP